MLALILNQTLTLIGGQFSGHREFNSLKLEAWINLIHLIDWLADSN